MPLREVIVTAQKYRQLAFNVPISMTTIGGPELRRLAITNLQDLQFHVPGMFVNDNGNVMRITIDGVSNLDGQAALVGTYLDDADVTSEASFGLDLDTYDLARVEVLKGPQGTLYGEGSVGGAIRYITNKPVLNEFQLGGDVEALFDQYGAPESRVKAVVNAPLVNGVLGLRVAAAFDQGGGWVDQPAAGQKNINSKNLTDVRMEGRWRPGADVTVDAMEVIHRASSGPYFGENPIGVYTEVFNLTSTPQLTDNYNISNLTATWSPGAIVVVNSATYFTHHNVEENYGGTSQGIAPPSPPFDLYFPSITTIDESLSDELRISGAGIADWRWTVGGFFKRLDNSTPNSAYYFGLPGPAGSPLPGPYPDYFNVYSNSKSVFGDTNYTLFGKLVVGAGVRYFRDNETALIVGDAGQEKQTFTSADPRFYVRYGISQDMNIYASAAKGFRSGGFNGLGNPPFQPEHAWTYNLGAKMRLFDHSVSIDSDVFVSNYNGYQIVGIPPYPNPPIDITYNAGDARIKGVEADVVWSPTARWLLSVNGDYINARFVNINVQSSAYDVGDPLDNVPRYQITALAQRNFEWLGKSGYTRLGYTQRARATYRVRSIGPWYYSQSDHMYLLDLRVGIEWTPRLELGVFGQNLLNDRGYTGADVVETDAPREQPRTFGVEFSYRVQ